MYSAVQFILASVYDVGTYAIAYLVSCYVLVKTIKYILKLKNTVSFLYFFA
jgi:hypothetical protein